MKEIKEVVSHLGEEIVSNIKKNMEEYGQGDSRLAHSLRYEANEESLKIYALDYWNYAQTGRGPGGTPRNFESILKSWAKRHSVSYTGDENEFVRRVKWSIIRYGTRMWRNGEVRDFLKDSVENGTALIEEEITKSLIEEIIETTKE